MGPRMAQSHGLGMAALKAAFFKGRYYGLEQGSSYFGCLKGGSKSAVILLPLTAVFRYDGLELQNSSLGVFWRPLNS